MRSNTYFIATPKLPATSLLDRLQSNPHENDLKSSLLRDLSNLFNTKLAYSDFSSHPEVARSIANYGLPCFAEYEANTQSISQQIKVEIEALLIRHEPRLRHISVKINRVEKTMITFSIMATLLNDPEPITIEFDSKYQPTIQQFKVKGVTE